MRKKQKKGKGFLKKNFRNTNVFLNVLNLIACLVYNESFRMYVYSLFTSPYTCTYIPMHFSFLLHSEVSLGPRVLMQQDINKKFILKSYMMLENKVMCLKGFPRGSWFSFTFHVLLVFSGKKDTMPVTVACSVTSDWEIYTDSWFPGKHPLAVLSRLLVQWKKVSPEEYHWGYHPGLNMIKFSIATALRIPFEASGTEWLSHLLP